MPTKGSVLVVDDNTDSREMLEDYLRYSGFDVTTAENGADAVTYAELRTPNVILMDLSMPGLIDGWEATRMIRRRPACRDSHVIAITAHAFPAYHELAMHAGCHAVMVKPVDLDAVSAMIQQFAKWSSAAPRSA